MKTERAREGLHRLMEKATGSGAPVSHEEIAEAAIAIYEVIDYAEAAAQVILATDVDRQKAEAIVGDGA